MTLHCNQEVLTYTQHSYCYVPMTTLISELSLSYQNDIKSKIIAANDRGESIDSDPNSDSVII